MNRKINIDNMFPISIAKIILRILFIVFCFKIAFSDYSISQNKISKIISNTENIISSEKLQEIFSSSSVEVFDSIKILSFIERTREALLKEGVMPGKISYDTKIDTANNLTLAFKFESIRHLMLNDVVLTGDGLNSGYQHLIPLKGEVFNKKRFEETLEKILDDYQKNGFPLAKILIDSFAVDTLPELKITLFLNMISGNIANIDGLKIIGNNITSESVIIKQSGISIGSKYKDELFRNIPLRLMKLDIFESVREPEFIMTNGKGLLKLELVELRSFAFDAVLGYVPSQNDDEEGYLTGLFNVGFRNLFGTARKFEIMWHRENRLNQVINLKYTEPFLFGMPVKTDIEFHQREQDSLYVSRNLRLGNSVIVGDDFTASIGLTYESVIPGNENAGSYFSKSKLYSAGFDLVYDTRNDLRFPVKGFLFQNTAEIGNKNYNSDLVKLKNKTIKKIGIKAEIINSFFSKQVLSNSVNAKLLFTDYFEQTDLVLFGGINSVRGYRDNQFAATNVVWMNNEYKFYFGDNTSIYPFFDLAYYKLAATEDGLKEKEEFLYSYGIGMNVMSGIGIIRLNFSLGKNDKLSGMKVHLGFKNNF